uniref:Uncharacterized protein n=1 Tax=Solanum lycopersicum TaxID=4081 RepID=K4BZG6_SOLLC
MLHVTPIEELNSITCESSSINKSTKYAGLFERSTIAILDRLGEQDSKNSKQVGVGIIDLTISGEGAGALMNVVEVRNLENVPSNADNNPKIRDGKGIVHTGNVSVNVNDALPVQQPDKIGQSSGNSMQNQNLGKKSLGYGNVDKNSLNITNFLRFLIILLGIIIRINRLGLVRTMGMSEKVTDNKERMVLMNLLPIL